MNLTFAIQRNAVFYFVALLPFVLWAFWYTYLSLDLASRPAVEHIHGASMLSWCLLLVLQATLVRSGARRLHRQTGRLSYLLVPVITVFTLLLAHLKLSERGLEGEGPLVLGLQFFLLLQFLLIYGLAIAYRKRPDVHARYMVCTALPLIDPIFNRILSIPLAASVPVLAELALFITFGATLLIPLSLWWLDRRAGYSGVAFRNSALIVVATLGPILALLFIPGWLALWRELSAWYLHLPLSG